MFAQMRRSDRQLDQEQAIALLERAEYGLLATVGTDGYPYAVPLHYVLVQGKLYFHCALDAGSKVENMRANPKVCFTVVGETQVLPEQFSTKYESVVVFGQAQEVFDQTKQTMLERIIAKYASAFAASGHKYIAAMFDKTAVYEITIEHMTGKARR